MASKEDINNQRELNKEMGNTKSAARGVNEEIGSLYDQLRGVTSELGNQSDEITKSRNAFRSFEKAAQDLKLQQEGINRLTDDQVKKLNKNLEKQQAIANQEVQRLKAQNSYIQTLDSELDLLREQGDSQQNITDYALQQIQLAQDLTDEQKAILSSSYDQTEIAGKQTSIMGKILIQAQEELSVREDVNKAMGVSGGILKGLNEIGGSFAKAFKLDEVVGEMEKFADETIRTEGSVSRLAVLGVGMKSAFTNAFKTLTDPSVIITNLVKGFTAVDKQAVSFQRMTGQNMNTMATSVDAANTHFITMGDYIQTAGELTAELGMNANNIFSSSDIQEASEMAHAMGMTGAEAAKIAKISTTNGKSLRENNEAIVDSVNSFNKQNKTAVMSSKIFKDIAKVSDDIAILYTGYPEKLASAASAANSIGMELGDVANIASNLLNFESSIGAELEAELITGQALNLEKARSLAMSNDLEGLAKEIANQGITSASFAALGAKGQEAQAKALGMSTAQLSKMLIQQGLTTSMSQEGLSDAQKQELSLMKQEEAQVKITKAIEKMQQVFAPIVEVVADVLTGFLGIVSGAFQLLGYLGLAKPLMFAIVGAIAISKFTSMAKAAGEFKDNLKGGLKLAKDIGSKIFGIGKGTKDLTGPLTKSGKPDMRFKENQMKGADKAGESIGKSADKTKNVKGNIGKEIEKFLKGVGRGLTFIGQNFANIMKGSLALLVASPGLIALGLAAPGLFVLSMIPGPAVNAALQGVARGIMFFGKNFVGVAKGALALGLAGLALGGSFALAMMMVKDVDPGQMLAFSGSLTMLGLTMALLGNVGANIIIGAAAIGILALSLIPAAFAFSLLAGVDVGSMIAFSIALPLLALAAAGLGFIAPFIMAGAGALAVLGLSLIPLSAGFALLSSVDTSGMISGFIELASIAPGLTATAAALFAVAGGMTAVGVAGYLALPAMALMSMFGGSEDSSGSKKDDGSLKKVEEKLDQLISIVSAGGDVYIDGSKVGKTLQLASSKMG